MPCSVRAANLLNYLITTKCLNYYLLSLAGQKAVPRCSLPFVPSPGALCLALLPGFKGAAHLSEAAPAPSALRAAGSPALLALSLGLGRAVPRTSRARGDRPGLSPSLRPSRSRSRPGPLPAPFERPPPARACALPAPPEPRARRGGSGTPANYAPRHAPRGQLPTAGASGRDARHAGSCSPPARGIVSPLSLSGNPTATPPGERGD